VKVFSRAPDSAEIPVVLAYICALLALESIKDTAPHVEDVSRMKMKCPHPVQLLAIFRLLAVDDPPDSDTVDSSKRAANYFLQAISLPTFATKFPLKNSFAQILTGEGKSIVIGTLAIFLALCGFYVDCVCYSKYLSGRDYAEFVHIFQRLNIDQRINYWTFGELSSKNFNENGDVRKGTQELINGNLRHGFIKPSGSKARILLIDEVDTFFSKDFYGALYTPSKLVKSKEITNLLKFIWDHRGPELSQRLVQESSVYQALCAKYKNKYVQKIINAQILKMIRASTTYEKKEHEHVVEQGRIGIVEHGVVNFNLTYGYNTTFWYLKEYLVKKTIDKAEFNRKIGLNITCGRFSYAEIPYMYTHVLGVTGTLPLEGSYEEKIILLEYKIDKWTKLPSLYGVKDSSFDKGVHIEKTVDDWNRKIGNEIKLMKDANRAVLVFFENEGRLRNWESSGYGMQLMGIESLTSGNVEYINHYVRGATRSKKVTLFPKVFGRGLDFVCLDKKVNGNGGVHVIQTFLSEEKSEEIQIKGRTCRQGNTGSYKMILCLDDLTRWNELKGGKDAAANNFVEEKEITDIRENQGAGAVYKYLDEKRNKWFSEKSKERSEAVKKAKDIHEKSKKFQKDLCDASRDAKERCLEFLMSLNYAGKGSNKDHICLCLDKSGSMRGQRWIDLHEAKKAFLNSCESTVVISIVTFNNQAQLLLDMGSLDQAKNCNLGDVSGGTAFAPALTVAEQVLLKGISDRNPVLVFMSDGANGDIQETHTKVGAMLSSLPQLDSHFVFFGHPSGSANLNKLASTLNGKFHNSVDGVELCKTFEEIACGITAIA